MDILRDERIVLTLDAGGTHFVFGAMRGGTELLKPITRPSHGHDLSQCLATITEGFEAIRTRVGAPPDAISFAFPGPSDYPAGLIGDLVNLPGFRGRVPLGPMLQDRFGVPVFINNDGDLFTFGEAIAGLLPEVNRALETAGSTKRFANLLGVTLGTGFGCGLVHSGRLFRGDNSSGMEIWCLRNKRDPRQSAEEGVSIRAIRNVYAEQAGIPLERVPDPETIFRIGIGAAQGHQDAAWEAFRRMGEIAGDAIAQAVTLVDALVVIGGGLSGAARLFLPELITEMNGTLDVPAGSPQPRMEMETFNFEDPGERQRFLLGETRNGLGKRIAVGITRLGTSRAIALGAYAIALQELDGPEKMPG